MSACGSDKGKGSTTSAPAGTAAIAATTYGPSSDLVAAAKKEGSVVLYSSQDQAKLDAFAALFQKKYGIEVTVVRGVTGDLLPKVDAEIQTGKRESDVVVVSDRNWLEKQSDAGNILAPSGGSFKNPEYDAKRFIPAGTYFAVGAGYFVFGWNTDEYPDGIDNLCDLTKPELADGKVGLTTPDGATQVTFYLQLEQECGPDYLAQLAAQKPLLYPSVLPLSAALTSGEVWVASYILPPVAEVAKGAPIKFQAPKVPVANYYMGAILKGSPHPNAAQLLADFMVTAPAQKVLSSDLAAVLPNVPGTRVIDSSINIVDPTKTTPEVVKEFQERFKELFQS